MSAVPEIVFDGAHLRATLFNPGGRKLFTSFRQRVPRPETWAVPEPVHAFTSQNYAHLHIQSRANDWYINADTEALEAVLDRLSAGYAHSVAMGFSMGGYGALRFARALRLSDGMYVSASSIPPFHADFDHRYQPDAPDWIRALSLLETHGKPDLQGLYLYDPYRRRDRLHAARLATLQPGVVQARLYGGGHPATQAINGARNFSQLQKWLKRGRLTRANVTALHRASRRDAAIYWRHLAEVAARHGRTDLAALAEAQHATLAALTQKSTRGAIRS